MLQRRTESGNIYNNSIYNNLFVTVYIYNDIINNNIFILIAFITINL